MLSTNIERKAANANVEIRTTAEVKAHRMEALKQIARANISVEAFQEISPWIDSISKEGLSLGYAKDLTREYAKLLLENQIEEMILLFKNKCFENYSTIFDGTPSFADAEAIILRMVTKDYRIIQVVVRVALFDKSLDANALCHNILSCISYRLGLDLKDWVASMQDRASTNSCALRLICERTQDAKPSRADCTSHTFNNTAQEMISEKKKRAPNCSLYRKNFQSIIQYPGKARDTAKTVFQDTVKDAGGVRFFRHFEQIVQLISYGLEEVTNDIVKPTLQAGSSRSSCTTLLSNFDGLEKKAQLGMAMVEAAAICDFGHPLCTACYTLEGDSPLILSAHSVFSKIDQIIESIDDFPIPTVEKVIKKAASLINDQRLHLVRLCTTAEEHYNTLVNDRDAKQRRLEDLLSQIDTTSRTSGRARRPTARVKDTVNDRHKVTNDNIDIIRKEIDNILPFIDEAKRD